MKIFNPIIKEEVYFEKLDNGLEVYFMPKKGFSKQYAVYSTNYGSNDLNFIPINENEKIFVNDGIAHFLEHKMFEQPDESNAFDKFAKWGASANAYTNFSMTSYLFSCTENFYDCLDHLLDYVQTPHFTNENVEKEKGIIAQEIKMYEDNPDWRVFFNTLRALYKNHPTRIDIAGTVDSIYKITPEELYKCYNTFYNPENMALFVVGDLNWKEVLDIVKKSQKNRKVSHAKVEKFFPNEPQEVFQKIIEEEKDVLIPMFNIGFKETNNNVAGLELMKKDLATEIAIEMVFKKGAPIYEFLYNAQYVNDSFSAYTNLNPDHGYSIISGEGKNPLKVYELILEKIDEIKEKGFDNEYFERIKKKKIGAFIKSFDSLEYIANNFISYKFNGMDLLEYLKILKDIKLKEVEDRFKEHFNRKNSVISIVKPK